ncbi:MAG: family 78 glycoside hydrolase catalytic domain, partial [Haloferula sp.]
LGGNPEPRLEWKVTSDQRNVKVEKWQILVASSTEALANNQGNLWDSGQVEASRNFGARYAGKPLDAGSACHWKVRWWNGAGEASPWSENAVWEVAPHSPADWKGAKWMSDGRPNPTKDEDFYKEDRAPLMRREFELRKPVKSARLHVAGLGLCLPRINGEAIKDHAFDPPWTNFDKRILFRTHDLTEQLKEGSNCLAIELGNGWYNPLPLRMWGRRNIREALPVGRPRAIACLLIEHNDGSTTTVTSDSQWTTAPGPTLRNSIYLGEERDARLEKDGWDQPGFKDPEWEAVEMTDDPLTPLMPLRMPPARKLQALQATRVTSPSDGVHIVDFGENFTGLPELTFRNQKPGTRILLRFGELLHEDGTLNPMTSVCGQIKGMTKDADGKPVPKGGPGAPEFAWQQSVYITKGGPQETFVPRFTFHSFRYMEISGLDKAPGKEQIRAFPLHTDLKRTGEFTSSDDGLNRIQAMCDRTFLANVVTVQSDCPHRERFGYGGDIVATSETYLMNYDMAGFYAKTVRDWSDAALPDGNFTDTAPFVGIQYCGVGWAMVHPLLMEQLYQHYGDKRLIEEELPAAIKWFNLEASKREKGGLVMKGLGDHEALKRIAGPVITTPMFIDTAHRMARLCRIVGDEDNAKRFSNMAKESAQAWATVFLDEESGKVGAGSQTEQTLALAWADMSEASENKTLDLLLKDLTKDSGEPSLTTGIFGTRYLLEELTRRGRSDLAHALATRKTFPSWGWMLENGATTLWEDWEGTDGGKSHNHPMFGSISGWFFRWLGGIQCA